jgi:hypothetical protein
VDESDDSRIAEELFRRNNVEYVRYHVINSRVVVVPEQVMRMKVQI